MAQTPDEKTYVKIPFIKQLKGMGWDHIEGDIDVPYLLRSGTGFLLSVVIQTDFGAW